MNNKTIQTKNTIHPAAQKAVGRYGCGLWFGPHAREPACKTGAFTYFCREEGGMNPDSTKLIGTDRPRKRAYRMRK